MTEDLNAGIMRLDHGLAMRLVQLTNARGTGFRVARAIGITTDAMCRAMNGRVVRQATREAIAAYLEKI